ncbi:4-diphosphocytidyl-2-C-methyl-D-erythritol kinase [Candidatus Rhodobacter oscarellae]|uniref:4-diphosphocytidyl-2-C-methyl-D-erythritol kinase n=1 Tax=Candidatus Rhodobacter oscarellae TaxID=1675527 RepID=A0A0J9EAV1_9RHOB|nr:4-(cytidine 5'-diphospho)-2-C-methyl-D-erythritol kinase [Candidatus Rhodobacter lobularis]KMW59912.1 4-diphosphocytidyl-2-C-methyl-D-erythritol kinase [Candidatus Rhodobacter lobularis]
MTHERGSGWAQVFAPAKVNLCLHVTGRREDGYHLIDSLVCFAPFGDHLDINRGNTLSLTVEGPEAQGVPSDMQNLAMKAAAMVAGVDGYALTLTKNLPAASGIGGGSADAAAVFRGILGMNDGWIDGEDAVHWPEEKLRPFAYDILALGADIPMCMLSHSARVRGIGEKIEFVSLGALPAVLVNPRLPVSTAEVFSRLAGRENPPLQDEIPSFANAASCIEWLQSQRNDLQEPAIATAPAIADVLTALAEQPGCGLSRMSGSGATCFGLFASMEDAREATNKLSVDHPEWWVAGGPLGSQFKAAMPKFS